MVRATSYARIHLLAGALSYSEKSSYDRVTMSDLAVMPRRQHRGFWIYDSLLTYRKRTAIERPEYGQNRPSGSAAGLFCFTIADRQPNWL